MRLFMADIHLHRARLFFRERISGQVSVGIARRPISPPPRNSSTTAATTAATKNSPTPNAPSSVHNIQRNATVGIRENR